MGFMWMPIAWRNPHLVQTVHRWLKVSDAASGSAYVIQAGRRQVNGLICPRWKYKQDGGNGLGPRAQNRASHG